MVPGNNGVFSGKRNKKQDESNVLIVNYDRILNVYYIPTYTQISGVNLYSNYSDMFWC
jgi:hypothetical protein